MPRCQMLIVRLISKMDSNRQDGLEVQGGDDCEEGLEVLFQGWENVKKEGGEICARYARMRFCTCCVSSVLCSVLYLS